MIKDSKVKKEAKVKNTKKIFSTGGANGEIFWNSENKEVCYVHENDGDFRPEYMTKIITMTGFSYQYVKDKNKVPDYVKEELESYDDEENDEEE